jgi:ketosteroid isomerase-like protein
VEGPLGAGHLSHGAPRPKAGREGSVLERFWGEFWSTFESVEVETHGYMQVGADVVIPNTARLRGRKGIEVVARSTFVYTVEKGEITRLRMFQERAEALEAAGLSQ